MKRKSQRKHWYKMIVDDGCVLCGASSGIERVRVYGRKPKNPDRRWGLAPQHVCNHHFM